MLTRDALCTAHPWPGPDVPEMRRARTAGDGGRDGHVLPRHGRRMFDFRDGTVAEADITLVDLATYAREGLQRATLHRFISLIQHGEPSPSATEYLGRPIVSVTDEGHASSPRTRCSRPMS